MQFIWEVVPGNTGGEVGRRQGKEGNGELVNERVIAVGNWGSMPLKDLWETMNNLEVVPPEK